MVEVLAEGTLLDWKSQSNGRAVSTASGLGHTVRLEPEYNGRAVSKASGLGHTVRLGNNGRAVSTVPLSSHSKTVGTVSTASGLGYTVKLEPE